MKVIVAAGGRFHAFHLAHQLERYQVLQGLYTASYVSGDEQYVASDKIHYNRTVGFLDKVYNYAGGKYFVNPSSWYVMKDGWFDAWLAEQLAQEQSPDIVVGWAHYVERTVPIIKKKGAKLILECGSMHIIEQEKILREEFARWGKKNNPIEPANRDKILREYEKADLISVPSSHVRQSFLNQGMDPHKIITTPYGVDYDRFYVSRLEQPKKFRVIFVGMVSIQKGIGHLLEAWQKLNLPPHAAELLVVGAPVDHFDGLYSNPSVRYIGSVRQSYLRELYASASMLVLPSVQEGYAMVIHEAMAAGLPVLCTDRTGGQDIVEEGHDGFVVPVGNSLALAEKIGWAFAHQEDLFNMGLRAQQHVKRHTWNAYGKKIMKHYTKLLAGE